MLLKPNQPFSCDFTTESATGAATNADALPLGLLVLNGVDVAGGTVTITPKGPGRYRAAASVPATAVPGDLLEVLVTAAIAGVNTQALVLRGWVDGKRLADLQDLSGGAAGSAVRGELSAELARLDAAISSRLPASSYSAPASPTDVAAEVNVVLSAAHGPGSWEASGAGGGAVVQVLPLANCVQTQPVSPTLLAAYVRAAASHRIAVFDREQQPIDLRGKSLQFALETLSGGDRGSVDDVPVAGVDHNELVLDIPAELHGVAGLFRYAVRDVADGARVWAHGDYLVSAAAGPTTSAD